MTPETPILDALVAGFEYPPIRCVTTDEPLTKRERFAMAAMQGLCANREWFQWDFARVAQMARIQADDLIAELKANPEPE